VIKVQPTPIPPRRYLQKTDEFLAHWPLVNTSLASALILTGNYAVADLTSNRASLLTQINAEVAAENALQAAIQDRDLKRAAIRERIRQFNQAVRGFFPNSTYSKQLPAIPRVNDPGGVYQKLMQEMNDIWTQINAISPVPLGAPIPLVLTGTYNKLAFVADMNALLAAFTTIETNQTLAETARLTRDGIWAPMYERMKQYRLAVQGRFAAGSPLLLSLPTITPPAGHTPAPVNLSALWDAGLSKAVITFTASVDPGLATYELRACFGSSYKTDQEQVLDSLAAGSSPLQFVTDEGLVASGSKVFYKVYVVLGTGNEKGSRSVSVTRP